MENISTFPNEIIHITLGCVVHFHGHWNKMVPLMKPFIFVDLNNDATYLPMYILTYLTKYLLTNLSY
jgi:hypothetical protein